MLHVRHAAAAINEGLCDTVLITHGESGRHWIGRSGASIFPSQFQMQFEQPYGAGRPPTTFTIPVLRYMKEYGVTEEQLANIAVVQREWAAYHPRASFRDPITTDDVLNSKMICYPFRLLMCCLVTDGGGALIRGLDKLLKHETNLPIHVDEEPLTCVVRGAGRILDDLTKYRTVLSQ